MPFLAGFIGFFDVKLAAMFKKKIKNGAMVEVAENSQRKPVMFEKGEISEFAKTAFWAVVIALMIRTVLFEPFNIPSGSMKPTLLVGDYLFVNKPAYGYSRFSFFGIAPIEGRLWDAPPKRGDIVVFALPTQTGVNFIKRVIGLPGDKIQVTNGRLYINGQKIPREFVGMARTEEGEGADKRELILNEYVQTLPEGATFHIYEESDQGRLDNTEVFNVPEGHYFMMGDNRDFSQDSRVTQMVGPVPFENMVGRADFLFFSNNGFARMYEFWKWPWSIRYERLFQDIDPERKVSDSDDAQDGADESKAGG